MLRDDGALDLELSSDAKEVFEAAADWELKLVAHFLIEDDMDEFLESFKALWCLDRVNRISLHVEWLIRAWKRGSGVTSTQPEFDESDLEHFENGVRSLYKAFHLSSSIPDELLKFMEKKGRKWKQNQAKKHARKVRSK